MPIQEKYTQKLGLGNLDVFLDGTRFSSFTARGAEGRYGICLIEAACQKITWTIADAHNAETHAAIINLRNLEALQYSFFERSSKSTATVTIETREF